MFATCGAEQLMCWETPLSHTCMCRFTRMLETDSKAFLDLSCVCMM